MSIIDSTNPKHVLAWEHTYMDRKTRFFCTCREFEHEVDTPCTIRDAKFAQRVAIERFNEHIENLGKADKDVISDAVIVSEVRRPRQPVDETEITFIGSAPSDRFQGFTESAQQSQFFKVWSTSYAAKGGTIHEAKEHIFKNGGPEYVVPKDIDRFAQTVNMHDPTRTTLTPEMIREIMGRMRR